SAHYECGADTGKDDRREPRMGAGGEEDGREGGVREEREPLLRCARDIKTRIVRRMDRKSRAPFAARNRPSVRRGSLSASGRHARARGARRCSVRTVRSGRRRCAGPGKTSRTEFGGPGGRESLQNAPR